MSIAEEIGNSSLNNTNEQEEIIRRPLADFPKNIWGDTFTTFTFDEQDYHMLLTEIEILKKEVKSILTDRQHDVMEKLKLLDTIERLGISYHFKKEIEDELEIIYNTNCKDYPTYDVSTASLQFRLLRQHGFKISCGIFDNFINSNGKLKDFLCNDIKGLLNLYEATQLRTKEDIVLEEALACVTNNLKQVALPYNSFLGKQLKHALEQSLYKGHPRTEIRYFISFYEEDNSKNEILLKLAKLDYKWLQMLHKKELSQLSRWWQEVNLVSKLTYARNRMVECYYWALGCYDDPQYSQDRIFLTKTIALISLIDDTYDAHGTLDELEIFTDALERWDQKEIDRLPNYMKICYMALMDLSHEIEEELANQQKSYAIDYYKEKWKEYSRFSNIQSKWFYKKDLPKFEDYLKVGLFTSSFNLIVAGSLVFMKCATKEVFDWLSSTPKIIEASMVIGRLLNDVASHKFEKERDIATAIHCYMKNYGVSEEEAMIKLEEIADDAWKDFNEEWTKEINVPREVLTRILGLARLSNVFYKHDIDGYTNPVKFLKSHIITTLVNPIII